MVHERAHVVAFIVDLDRICGVRGRLDFVATPSTRGHAELAAFNGFFAGHWGWGVLLLGAAPL